MSAIPAAFVLGLCLGIGGSPCSAAEPGMRNVYIKMTPGKKAVLDRVWRDSRNVPTPRFAGLIDGKHPAVARIDVEGDGGALYHGSGTLIAASGSTAIVLTNWHVIRDAEGKCWARFPDGFRSEATVLKIDKTWDLAALVIDRPKTRPVRLARSVPKIGDPLTVAGYGGGTYRQSSGRLLQFCAPGMTEPEDILEITTGARSGDSGGPIFAQDGTLAGVLFGSISGTTNGSHIGRVRMFLESLIGNTTYVSYRG